MDAQGAHHHSDKEKFCSDLNRPEGCKMSERLLKTLPKFADFQAEYEGSIPFTRFNVFSALDRAQNLIPTIQLLHFMRGSHFQPAYLSPV